VKIVNALGSLCQSIVHISTVWSYFFDMHRFVFFTCFISMPYNLFVKMQQEKIIVIFPVWYCLHKTRQFCFGLRDLKCRKYMSSGKCPGSISVSILSMLGVNPMSAAMSICLWLTCLSGLKNLYVSLSVGSSLLALSPCHIIYLSKCNRKKSL